MSDFPQTAQEIFDKVADHLVRQGKPAKGYLPKDCYGYAFCGDGTPGCMYRAPDGTSCAFGCLIPDHRYHPSFENRSSSLLIDGDESNKVDPTFPELKPFAQLIVDLQNVHDSDDSWNGANLVRNLRAVAEKHGLSTTVFQ